MCFMLIVNPPYLVVQERATDLPAWSAQRFPVVPLAKGDGASMPVPDAFALQTFGELGALFDEFRREGLVPLPPPDRRKEPSRPRSS